MPSEPGSFNFLGFTHFWGKSRRGYWVVWQKTAKAIHSQRFYRPEARHSFFPNLDLVLASRSIDWEPIEQQLDAMVKHAVAMKRGMADAESLLRRFTRANAPHGVRTA